ncbi:MAG TPA: hypothetical protein VLX44_13010 [Xanthobacteraceae bacterium]|nr:hypothetical protein [Xanthobacteraceae bacterium]
MPAPIAVMPAPRMNDRRETVSVPGSAFDVCVDRVIGPHLRAQNFVFRPCEAGPESAGAH